MVATYIEPVPSMAHMAENRHERQDALLIPLIITPCRLYLKFLCVTRGYKAGNLYDCTLTALSPYKGFD